MVLGTMKGAAMKLGQMLSVLDLDLIPESHREVFREKLAALRDQAPAAPFSAMRKVIETDLGPLSGIFRDFDETAIAAASVGQVYRATLRDGRAVAVKVQYPGVDDAVRADMRNLKFFGSTTRPRHEPSTPSRADIETIRSSRSPTALWSTRRPAY